MKRSKKTVLVLSIAAVLILGIFLSFYWSYVSVSDENVHIALPPDTITATTGTGGTQTPFEKVEITKGNVQRVISSMSRPASCSFESRVTIYASSGSITWKNHHYVKNGYTKTEQYNASGALIKNSIAGNGMIFIWRPGGDARYYSGHIGDATSDTVSMIPTYEDIINLQPSEILDAKYESYQGSNCIYVKAEDGALHYVNEYWISLDYGLLIRALTKSKDQTVYEMTAGTISTSDVSDSVFLLPNNKLAMDVTLP